MIPVNKGQLAAIGTLVNKLGLSAVKKDLVNGFSSGRVESSKDLSMQEAKELIQHLKSLDKDEASAERMRKKIISLAHVIGWKLKGDKIDMIRVDDWCLKFSYKKKKLNHYLLKELPVLVTQFENGPYKSYINGI